MDSNLKHIKELRTKRVMDNLSKNNMNPYLAQNQEEVIKIIDEIVKDGEKAAFGGSMSLFELGVIDHVRRRKLDLYDRYAEGITLEERDEVYRKSFYADVYFTSTNAITEDGALYNVDGTGNRVAAMIWGPKKVIVVCGINKIVKDEAAAVARNREIAAPANAKRLNMGTPCAQLGYCVDCNHKDRICSAYTMIRKQRDQSRMHVILVNESVGY